MAAQASGDLYANLARLDEDAARAGRAMACAHQSADELHRDLIQRYFALRPRPRPFGLAIGATLLVGFLVLI
jgi:hypothetical protein